MKNNLKVLKKVLLIIVFFFGIVCIRYSFGEDTPEKRVAIATFQNLSTKNKEVDWIGTGFAETLTTKLINVKSITVIERRRMAELLKEIKLGMTGIIDEKTATKAGKIIGVEYMVIGSFQKVGEKIMVTAHIVNVETGEMKKSASVKGNYTDMFELQEELALKLVAQLEAPLTEEEKIKIAEKPTENLSAYQWFSKGIEVYNLKLYDKAIEYFTKAIKLNPKYAEAYGNRGIAYGNKGLYDEEIKDYNKAIEINPKDAVAYYNRGLAYYYKGLYDKAIDDYTKAIEIGFDDDKTKYASAYNNRGCAYADKGDYDKAIDDYNKAIELNPKDANVYYNRGIAYGKKELDDKAIKDFTKAIELNPKYADAYYNRGVAYRNKGLYDKAITDYNKAIEIGFDDDKTKYASAYYNRGFAYGEKGLDNLCISDWKRAADLGSEKARQNLKKFFNIDY